METKLVRIAEISATSKHPIFTSVYHLINEDMLKQCHKRTIVYIEANVTMRSRMRESRTYGSVRG